MADNLTTQTSALATIPDASAIATDEIGGAHYQRMKQVLGPNGTATADWAGRAIGSDGVGYIDPRPMVSRLSATSSGLTTASTAYTAGDQMGAQMSWANAVRAAGLSSTILSATLLDKADVIAGGVDLYLFDSSVTPAADNAAASFSDTDMESCVGVLSFPPLKNLALNRIATIESSGLVINCDATTLYGSTVTLADHTFFAATTDIIVNLVIQAD